MRTIILAASAVLGATLLFASAPAEAAQKKCGSRQSTECGPETDNKYKGSGGKKPTLRPTVCLPDKYYRMMTGPGISFWYDYELVYRNGSWEKGDGVVRTQCLDKQWVSSGMSITFWVDCQGYRWYFDSGRITDSGNYTYKLVKKHRI